MTPLESELLQHLGTFSLLNVAQLSIGIFFYGASSKLVVHGPSTSLIKGVFVILFSALVVILMFVFSFLRVGYFISWRDLIPRGFTGGEDFPTAQQQPCLW